MELKFFIRMQPWIITKAVKLDSLAQDYDKQSYNFFLPPVKANTEQHNLA